MMKENKEDNENEEEEEQISYGDMNDNNENENEEISYGELNDIELKTYDELNNTIMEDKCKNKLISQGFKEDRTYVVKDNNEMDVFKTNILSPDSIKLENIGQIKPTKKNKDISIKDLMLYDNEKQMLFLDYNKPESIWQYDLNKESIVQEWNCGEFGSIVVDLAPHKKLGQMEEGGEMIAINSKNVFLLDGRVKGKDKAVQSKTYSNSPGFNCLTTTIGGNIAVGARNGDIRLYKDACKNAKTLIPCFGDPIKSLDTTYDGKYILATCDNYLMLICAEGEDFASGFLQSLSKARKKPITLKLSQEDISKYNLSKETYTPAKFDTNKTNKERIIVSSLGNYIIVWNLENVKKGVLNAYEIQNINEYVINSVNKFNQDHLVVATPNKIRVQSELITPINK